MKNTRNINSLEEYLKYYVKLDNPGYAVLVTGEWGTGKTFQVKELISEEQRYYVSLYGIDSSENIHKSVIESSIPTLSRLKGWGRPLGKALTGLAKTVGFSESSIDISGLFSKIADVYIKERMSRNKTIIFDDLERSHLWNGKQNELLGAINHYLEHEGFRVIVICNEDKIRQLYGDETIEQSSDWKEKLFGQTIYVTPNVKDAFDSFLKELSEDDSKFIKSRQEIIEEVWRQSNQKSLRLLRYIIKDIARLKNTLKSSYFSNNEAINHIVRFFAFLILKYE